MVEKNLKAFGQNLTHLRTSAGLSRKELLARLDEIHIEAGGEEITISPQLLWNWEKAYTYKGRQWTPGRVAVLYLIELFVEQLTLTQAQSWAAQAGYRLGTNELGRLFPSEDFATLTWDRLQRLSRDISAKRMAGVQHRYNTKLYVPRRETCRAFEAFLASDKRGFVLTGNAGVGKSNFLLAVQAELQQSREDICLLLYDGAHLQVESCLNEVITQDFNHRLQGQGARLESIWPEIACINGMARRQVILCLDALSENAQAKALLKQLDALVQSPWPWLKVVISVRPASWQIIKRGVRLSEGLYYRMENEPAAHLEPFSASHNLGAFSAQIFPHAYARYQIFFKLQAPLSAVSPPIQALLRDPLTLWLVAQRYRGQALPQQFDQTAWTGPYLEALLRRDILYREDLRLVQRRLVPLMMRHGDYRNRLSVTDLESADRTLYELLFNEQQLPNGRRINCSFTHLCDAGILAYEQIGGEEAIRFTANHLYEHFVGHYIFEMGAIQADQPTYFAWLIAQSDEIPGLWGAVRQALCQVVIQGHSELLMRLSFTDSPRVKAMVMTTLIALGQNHRRLVKHILEQILPEEKAASRWQSLWKVLHKSYGRADLPRRHAHTAAINVAGQLQFSTVLETGILQLDRTVRTAALRQIYYLWRNNRSLGFEILERLAWRAVPGLVPHLTTVEAIIRLSALMLIDAPHDPTVRRRLRTIWREGVERLLGLEGTAYTLVGNGWGRWQEAGRKRLVGLAMRLTMAFLSNAAEQSDALGHRAINVGDLENLLHLE